MPVVSIIMPAFNCSDFISESIQSVKKQSFVDWELLIVDDCSTDNTVELVLPYLTDSRIQLIRNPYNFGGAESRNKAIEVAQGKYIAFLDSDDLWVFDKLQRQIKFMQQKQIGFSFSSYSTISEQGKLIDIIHVPEKVSFSSLLKHNYIGCLTAMYDTQPFGKIYMPLVRKRQDFALWLELLKHFDYAYGLQKKLGFYRIRAGSLSASKSDALKFYWRVLRKVGGCNFFSAMYNISCYLFIVFLKKKCTHLYHRAFVD